MATLPDTGMTTDGPVPEPYYGRDLTIYLCATLLSEIATLMQLVAIGWRVYEISGRPLTLGFLGLAQFIPLLLVALPAGELCDRLGPRRILSAGLLLQFSSSALFFTLTLLHVAGV